MADSVDQVSSSTSLFRDEMHHYEPSSRGTEDPELDPEPTTQPDVYDLGDIVDLIGGAKETLERHIAEDSAPREATPEPLVETLTAEAVEEEEDYPEEPIPSIPTPDSTSIHDFTVPKKSVTPEPEEVKEEEKVVEVVAPVVAEPESLTFVPEPEPEMEPVTPESDAPPEPQKAAPSPAVAAEQPAVREEPPAPASYEPSPSKAQLHPLMQFPTALGQKGDSPAPISPLSPLHSPDSLEELSLTESPNQPPPSGYAASFASTAKPPTTQSSDMPWVGEETRGKNKEDLLDPIAGPYLSLGKDPGPLLHNPCEDSGVSFSPEEKLSSADRSPNPQMKVPQSDLASSNPTEHWDSPFLTSQDNSKVSMDPYSSKDTTAAAAAPVTSASKFAPDLHGNQSDEDDDLMYEVKKNNNPFDGYSPLADSGYSHFGDSKKTETKMSDSPTPDLVQYGHAGESLDAPLAPMSLLDDGNGKKTFETSKMAADSFMQSVNQFSPGLKVDDDEDDDEEEEEDAALPPSLPDILKSSPLNPEKLDSGSSEGSPEQSPILERRMMESPNPPINLSANNPFAFDAKVSLLKEMTEQLEVKSTDKVKVEDDDDDDSFGAFNLKTKVEEDLKSFGAFDLVKEAEETTSPISKVKAEEPVKIEQKDWFSSHDSPTMTKKFEPLDFESKKGLADDSDSESPTADSLSPVLEAMAKNPAIFQVETEKDLPMDGEEAAEEVSEHEVSSEEFEFIERPPRGVIDEFLEALDTSKFASSKPPEIPMDEDLSFLKDAISAKQSPSFDSEDDAPSQSSYRILTQASPQKSKAELEKLDIQQPSPPSQAPLTHSPVSKPEEAPAKKSATEGGKLFKMPKVNITAVVDLLYWRDVKTSGVVFGAAMLLLLSLMACSIVSVCSYIGLALLSVTICFRIYKGILQAIQKSDDGHPFKQYLDQEVALSEEMVHKYSDLVLAKLNKTIGDLRRVFLVEDLVDSIKFAVLMWILTYVGALFNGLTLLILALIALFSCPIIYEKHQTQIDHYVGLVNNQVKDIVGKIQEKVPGMKRKAE